MKFKTTIIIVFALLLVGGGSYKYLFAGKKPAYEFASVKLGNVVREVSATGQVEKGEEIKLGFKNSGKIEIIYVGLGDEVESGQKLAKLETTQLYIQLSEAQAVLEVAKAKLNKLLAGAGSEEIEIAETSVSNAEIALENAEKSLRDAKTTAATNLKNDYEDALNILDDSYLKLYNAFNAVDSIQRSYFNAGTQESFRVIEEKNKFEQNLTAVKSYLDQAKIGSEDENVDAALSEFKKALENASASLKNIREICESQAYRSVVSSADKTSLDTHRSHINTALTNIVNAQQSIASTKLANETNINAGQTKVDLAEGELKAAKAELAKIIAPARREDIDLYQAQIKQAEAQVKLYQNQIQESTLLSPADGQITDIGKRKGETAQPTESVFSFLPSSPFQIKADIYEEDIVKIKTDNPVDIKLTSYPDKILKGKVIFIDPAEKLIEGVVYYELTIDFDQPPSEVKPGMTADAVIKTDQKENVLIIPKSALLKKNGKFITRVFKNGIVEEREIEIGLAGSDDSVEVISGLSEGEKVITKK